MSAARPPSARIIQTPLAACNLLVRDGARACSSSPQDRAQLIAGSWAQRHSPGAPALLRAGLVQEPQALVRNRKPQSRCGSAGSFGRLGRHQDRRRLGSRQGCKPMSVPVAAPTPKLPVSGRTRVAAPPHRWCISDAIGSCEKRARREVRRRCASRSSPRGFESAGYCRGLELDACTHPSRDRIGFAASHLAASAA